MWAAINSRLRHSTKLMHLLSKQRHFLIRHFLICTQAQAQSHAQRAECARVGGVQAAEQALVVLLGLARLGQPRLLRAAVLLQGSLGRRCALHQAVVVRPAHGPQAFRLVHAIHQNREGSQHDKCPYMFCCASMRHPPANGFIGTDCSQPQCMLPLARHTSPKTHTTQPHNTGNARTGPATRHAKGWQQ